MLKQVRAVSMGLQTLNICDYFKKINLLTGKCFRESIRFAWTSLFWFFGPPPTSPPKYAAYGYAH